MIRKAEHNVGPTGDRRAKVPSDGVPISRRYVFAGLGLALASPLLAIAPAQAWAQHTIGWSFDVETVQKNAWIANFQQTLDGVPFELAFLVQSATRDANNNWTVYAKFYKSIRNPNRVSPIYFNASVQIHVDNVFQIEFGPGYTQTIPAGTTCTHEGGPIAISIPNGGSRHITSKGKRYGDGITSVGKSYFNFHLTAPAYYVVTFKPGFGSNDTIKAETVRKGGDATAPAAPSREGYAFAKWDRAFANVQSNLTVTAVWNVMTFTVRFLSGHGGNAVLKSQSVNWGADATAPANPTRAGWEFTGWDRGFANVKSDIDVTALWEPAAIVSYYADGELMHSQGGLTPGEDVSVPAAAIAACRREGCTPGWTGWFTDAACTKRWEGGKVPAGTLNLYSYNELTLSFGATVDSAPTAGEFRTHPDADAPVATLIPAPRTVRYEASASLSLPQACYRNDGDGRWRTYRAEGYFGTPQGITPPRRSSRSQGIRCCTSGGRRPSRTACRPGEGNRLPHAPTSIGGA